MANRWQTLANVIGSPFGTGVDGDVTISSNTTQSETSRAFTGSGTSITLGSYGFTDGDVCLAIQIQGTGAGQWEWVKIASGGGTTSLVTTKSMQYTYSTGAVIQKFPQYNNVTLDSGKTWGTTAWDGSKGGIFGFISKGTVTISGSINANGGNGNTGTGAFISGGTGGGFRGGNSVNDTYPNQSFQGESSTSTSSASTSANGAGGGGGLCSGPSQGAGGGGAGYSTNGNDGVAEGSAAAGYKGSSIGVANLQSIYLGAGGGGGANDGNGSNTAGSGGSGAGIVFIYASTVIITGSIVANGGNGGSANENYAGGGGGAGGSILIKTRNATLGSNLITATGGSATQSGGAGSVGRIHIDYLNSYTGTTSPTLDATRDTSLLGSPRRTMFI